MYIHIHEEMFSSLYIQYCLSDFIPLPFMDRQEARLKYRKISLSGYRTKERVKKLNLTEILLFDLCFTRISVNQCSNCNLGTGHF